jgi:hypothetical protein
MMKQLIAAMLLLGMPTAVLAQATEEQQAGIDAALAKMQCEVDPANVEVQDAIFDLDDVICADGQYDIKMDAAFNVVEKRKE